MKKAYIDFTEFDVQRGNIRKAVDRAIAQTENQYSPVVFLARLSHVSDVESALVDRANCNVVAVTGTTEVLASIQTGRKRAEGLVPNASTDYVFTFSLEVRNAVMGWKAAGWNVYTRWASDLLAFNAPSPGSADSEPASAARSRNRKYEVAKHKAKKLRVYAEWRARREIYDAIGAATSAKGEVTLADLKRAVMRQAREGAANRGFDLQPNHFFAANDSVFRVALNVGVFRTDGGRSISDQDVAYVVQVSGIDPDFRDRSVQQYAEQLADPDCYRPGYCPQCQTKHPLTAHGFYTRTLIDTAFDGTIRVRRYLCQACQRTVSRG